MSSRRTLILVAAVALGAIASFVLLSYVRNVEDQAYGDAERVEVLVVRRDVPKGLAGEQALGQAYLERDLRPREYRPSTAVVDVESLRPMVAGLDLAVGQVVVAGMFVDPSDVPAASTSAVRLERGRVAVTVSVDPTRGVAGLVAPGDRVNVMVKVPAADSRPSSTSDDGDAGPAGTGLRTALLYQNVDVLAIGATLAPEVGGSTPVATEGADVPPAAGPGSNLVTLSVPPEAASRIAYVDPSTVYLALVGPDNEAVDVPPIDDDNLLSGDRTPYEDEDDQL